MRFRRRYFFALLVLTLPLVAAVVAPAETPPPFLLEWGTPGAAEGQFAQTAGVAVDALGHVYVSDTYNYRIQKFDSNGNFLLMWGWGVATGSLKLEICTSSCQRGSSGDGNGQLNSVKGLAVDALGNVYVADRDRHRIQKFTSNGTFLDKWGDYGTGAGDFYMPWFIKVDARGNVYVSDSFNNRIQKFDSNGNFVLMWGWDVDVAGGTGFEICTGSCQSGSSGDGNGQFNIPMDVAVDSSGTVYVIDRYNDRVQKFNSDGTYIAKWGQYGNGLYQFAGPKGAAIDALDNLYVVDSGNRRIQKYSRNGVLLAQWGTFGSDDNQFNAPCGVAVDAKGRVYVGDTMNSRVSMFGFPWVEIFVGEPELPGGR